MPPAPKQYIPRGPASVEVYMDDPISPTFVRAEDLTRRCRSIGVTTDPTNAAAVRTLLTAINTRLGVLGGGNVSLGAGTYPVSSIVALTNAGRWRGIPGKTIVKASGALATQVFSLSGNVELVDIDIDGNQQTSFGVVVAGNNVTLDRVTAHHTTIDSFLIGAESADYSNIKLRNCIAHHSGYVADSPTNEASGFEIYRGANAVVLEGCEAYEFTDNGIDIHDHIGENSPYNISVLHPYIHNPAASGGDGIGIAVYSGKTATHGDVHDVDIIAPKIVACKQAFQIGAQRCDIIGGIVDGYTTQLGTFYNYARSKISHLKCSDGGASALGIRELDATNLIEIERCSFNNLNAYAIRLTSPGARVIGCDFSNVSASATLGTVMFDATADNAIIDGNVFSDIATYDLYSSAIVDGVTISRNHLAATTLLLAGYPANFRNAIVFGNYGIVGSGEIRTHSGSIAALTENAFNSIDNPFGKAVRLLSLDIYVSTKATSTEPNIDCGIGSSAEADYTTLFDDLPGETVGFYRSTIASPGAQTVPQLWESGSGNRYLNMSIKGAAATGMVATYVAIVMGL